MARLNVMQGQHDSFDSVVILKGILKQGKLNVEPCIVSQTKPYKNGSWFLKDKSTTHISKGIVLLALKTLFV